MKVKIISIAVFLLIQFGMGGRCFAQNVGINTTGNAPNSSALLDVDASPGNNKGILIPRLPLTASNVGAPISPAPGAAEKGLMVYNTATAGISPNDVIPGFYFWTGSAWSPLGGGASGGGWTDDGTVVRLTTSTDFVGIGTASPASTSALDITSTTKGILIPRMTTNQRDAITTPATGLQIYNTDCQTLNYYTGTCWISINKAIPDPKEITSVPSSTTFCAGQTRTYSVPAVPGANYYTWTVPAGTTVNSGLGTTSIGVTFGNISGSVCVKASNACETSNQTCLAVNVDPIPNTPGNITGITSINPGQQSVTYFVASVNGASTYTWTVPAGATIASGTGTTTIVVNFDCNASSGNISVTANSTCGSSPASALALTITPLLSASAGAAVFGGDVIGGSPTASGGTTAYTYSWSPATNLSSATVANPTAVCAGSSTTYTVTVTDSRSCTATSSVVVTRNLTASAGAAKFGGTAIGGSPTATGGDPTYTYLWNPASDLSSSTIANPIAQCTGSTTTYTVTVSDANTCTNSSSVVVTRNLAINAGAAKFGGSTIGAAATGGNATYAYSWNPATNLSSSTVAVPTAVCAGSTTTYTVTATDANSCTATSSVVVTRNLTASAGGNQTLCSAVAIGGSPTAVGGNASYTYSWSPATGLSSTTVANPTANPGSTTTYTVTVTDGNACTKTSSMIFTVSGCTATFNYTGALQTWVVPSGVTSITINAYGAQGASSTGSSIGVGGLGGKATGTLAVSAGQTLNIYIGGQSGWNGGGSGGGAGSCALGSGGVGGGASDIRIGGTALGNRVIVAGGGAGGGAAGNCSFAAGGTGGAGGGTTGSTGLMFYGTGAGGVGGTQAAGGAGGSGGGCGAGNNGGGGALGVGGNGNSVYAGGGGGGGGYYGGGGGATCSSGAGGGGGSSYIGGLGGASTTSGFQAGNGQIVITY